MKIKGKNTNGFNVYLLDIEECKELLSEAQSYEIYVS